MMPEPDDATLEFKSPDKQFKAPYVIYADFECITEPISKANKNNFSSYTEAYQSHTPCGFCYQVVSSDPSQVFEPEIYRGEDTINEFLCRLRQTEDDLMELIKANTPMVMTAQDEQDFKSATCCNMRVASWREGVLHGRPLHVVWSDRRSTLTRLFTHT
jgi:hypothetical protein